jgi:hypothetical protein
MREFADETALSFLRMYIEREKRYTLFSDADAERGF